MKVAMKMDQAMPIYYKGKPHNFNSLSELIWGAIVIDWQWAINTIVWKEYKHD